MRDRAAKLREMPPQLIATVRLYAIADGGRTIPVLPGWGCPCMVSKQAPLLGYDGWPLLDEPLRPGDLRDQVGFVLLAAEGAEAIRRARRFYLWEGRFIGEAVVT